MDKMEIKNPMQEIRGNVVYHTFRMAVAGAGIEQS
jgi:hypothetical protein